MTKKKESDKDQFQRFLAKVKELEDASELTPEEVKRRFESAMLNLRQSDNGHSSDE